MKAGADAVGDMKLLLVVPLVTTVSVLTWVAFWGYSLLALFSMGEITKDPNSFTPHFTFSDKQK